MQVGRELHRATPLGDGRILVTGGGPLASEARTSELIDESNGHSTRVGDAHFGRSDHTATRLADGRVLLAGGAAAGTGMLIADTAEIFDPASGQFRLLAARLRSRRMAHTATLLADGRVLLVGSFSTGGAYWLAEIFDPATETFTPLGAPLGRQRGLHGAQRLADGSVLIYGGEDFEPASGTTTIVPAVLRFDPASATLAPAPDLAASGRRPHPAVRRLRQHRGTRRGRRGLSPQPRFAGAGAVAAGARLAQRDPARRRPRADRRRRRCGRQPGRAGAAVRVNAPPVADSRPFDRRTSGLFMHRILPAVASLLVSALAVAGCVAVRPATMALPEGLAARTVEARLDGLGGGTAGKLRVAGNSGPFTRAASQLTLFDSATFDRGGATFTVGGADFPAPVGARCRFRQYTVTLGVVEFKPKKIAYQCEFDGLPGARLSLQEAEPARGIGTLKAERRGRIEVDGTVLALRSVHELEGAVLDVAAPFGYLIEAAGRPSAAVELNGTRPRLLLPAADRPAERRAALLASIALALPWDPAAR